MAEKIKIIPLGGLNEIGKNMTVLEYGQDIIVIDAGMTFPDEDLLRHVVELYVAHYLTIGGSTEANAMGVGANPNPVASKSVDGVSVSYDTSSAIETNAGFWNATAFGRELWQLMKIFGAGARQI